MFVPSRVPASAAFAASFNDDYPTLDVNVTFGTLSRKMGLFMPKIGEERAFSPN